MQAELRGAVPKLPIAFTRTLVNRAWNLVRQSNLWSFLLYESSWISPQACTLGTVTTTQGSPTIVFDADALAALNASQIQYPTSLLTQRQFRTAFGGIYSILTFDPNTGIATLDRIFGDIGGPGQAYQVYQLYYAPPFKDHLTWVSVRNPQMFLNLGLVKTRAMIDAQDPQRSWYQFPSQVVPFGIDLRGQGTPNPSATLGYPLFELWGQPVSPFIYQCYGIRRGTPLINPDDTLPVQVDEDCVLAKAYEWAYQWAEANKDPGSGRLGAAGPDYKFLMGKVAAEYKELLKKYRKQDKEFVDNWFTIRGMDEGTTRTGYYNTIAGTAGPYAQY